MDIQGHVENGVVILEEGRTLPEGAIVTVSYQATANLTPATGKKRIQVPLVRTGKPGSVDLNGERIAQMLDDEDAASRR